MSDIFLSYSRVDQETARLFAQALQEQGFSVWWDTELRSGETYDSVIESALRDAKAVVVLWSKHSVNSRWVRSEAAVADRNGTLMPVTIENCDLPVMFALVQTSDLEDWRGKSDDPEWLNFIVDLRSQMDRGVKKEPQTPKPVFVKPHAYRFGDMTVLPDRRTLLRGGTTVSLDPKVFDLLLALVRHHNEVLEPSELGAIAWPGSLAADVDIPTEINNLRNIVGPQIIATIPGKGYQFVASLSEAALEDKPRPSAQSAQTVLGNISEPKNVLLGRDDELETVTKGINDNRLVTICGSGGMGKSRLALAVLAGQADKYTDGVWWIELAPVTDPALLVSVVARSLDLAMPPDATVDDLVVNLADRHLLIAFDNCEHILEPIADLIATLRDHLPNLQLIATSQESLKVEQEHVYRLPPLSVPEDAENSLSKNGDGALKLFEARAKVSQSGFQLTDENRTQVAHICRQLDGLPLAIELAAARVSLLGLDGVAKRIDDRFKLVAGRGRQAPERHRTLRSALEWSHSLLSPEEQIVFARLSVFVGGFYPDAAEIVCADEEIDGWTVLEIIEALHDKSLISMQSGDLPRYRLLESPRAFASEQLDALGDREARNRAHAEFMRARLIEAQDAEWLPSEYAVVQRMLTDLDNLRAALVWAAGEQGDPALLVNLAGTGSIIWKTAGADGEGYGWCEVALKKIGPETSPLDEAELLTNFAILSHQSDAEREIAALERAAELYRELGDNKILYVVLGVLAKKQIWRRNLTAAEKAIAEAEALFKHSWPAPIRETLLQAKTYLFEISGVAEKGEPLMVELVEIMQALGDPQKIDMALMELAESYCVQQKWQEAVSVHREVMRHAEENGQPYRGSNLANLFSALTQIGELDEAVEIAKLALPLIKKIRKLETFLDHFALLACKIGRLEHASRLLGRSDYWMTNTGYKREVSEEHTYNEARQIILASIGDARFSELHTEGERGDEEILARTALFDH